MSTENSSIGLPGKKVKLNVVKLNVQKHELHVPRWKAGLFAAVFGIIGVYFVWSSLAVVPVVASVEAERMTLPFGASIVTSSSASNGKAVRLTRRGTSLQSSVNLPSNATSFTIIAHGRRCDAGWPTMAVSVDNTSTLTNTRVGSSNWQTYSANIPLSATTHSLSITDTSRSSCRSLYIDSITFYGPTAVTPKPTISFSASPASVAAGGASTLTWSSTNTTSCLASGAWTGSKANSGSLTTGALNSTTSYSLTCSGSGGSATASASVTVTPATTGGGTTGGGTTGGGSTGGGTTGGGTTGGGSTGGGTTGGTGSWWKPTASTPISWNWVIGNTPSAPYAAVKVYDIDGFDNSAATVSALHAQGSKTICYIDVGTYEPGRPDLNLIPAADIGSGVQGWPGEKWLNIADVSGLSALVKSRMQVCASKGFDAVEPDNIDGYTNSTGFSLTAANQIAYNQMLASTAHSLGLSVGLKNDVDQTSQLQPYFDWALDEECNKYSECGTLAPFTGANKAVFNAEYTNDGETTAKFCAADVAAHINGTLFNLNLDGKTFQPCLGTW